MNRIIFLLGLSLLLGLGACDSENAPNCLQTTGDIVQRSLELPAFNRVTVFDGVSAVIKQGDRVSVVLEAGENLIDDIDIVVTDGRLEVTDSNGCNLLRSYGTTKIYITHPNLAEIRSSTGWPIISDGPLNYPFLALYSESYTVPEADNTSGSFDLELDNDRVSITSNGVASFKLRGRTGRLGITIAAGDARVNAQQLEADIVSFDHRGSNDLLVFPLLLLEGRLRGTGDVQVFNRPTQENVTQLYKGKLVYMD